MKIFLVEDDENLQQFLIKQLTRYGYVGVACENFQQVTEEFLHQRPQLVLLDVNLPYFDGFYWCQELRKISNLPIIFLSSRNHPLDQVLAVEYGGDDYVTKPFSSEVLLAKIKSQLRRAYGTYRDFQQERILEKGGLSYYPERLEVSYQSQKVELSKREGDLLELLLSSYPQVSDRETILNRLWDEEQFVDDNTLSVNITRLRKKLVQLGLPNALQTVRSLGYRLVLGETHENF